MSILVHWFLRYQCSILPSSAWPYPLYLDSWTNIPGFYAIVFFIASDFTFTIGYIQNKASFILWPSHSFLFGAISSCPPLFPSSILDNFWPLDLIFQYHIFLPLHTGHGVLKAKIQKWLAISSSSGSSFFITLHFDLPILGGSAWHGSALHWIMQVPSAQQSPSQVIPLSWQKGLCNSEPLSHAVQGHPRQTGHSKQFWWNIFQWRRKWQTAPVFLPWELYEKHVQIQDFYVLWWQTRRKVDFIYLFLFLFFLYLAKLIQICKV